MTTPLKKWRCVVVERVYQTFEVEAADWDTAEQIAAGLFDATNRTDAEVDVVDTQEIEQ
jgi:hypothetical protein